MNTYEFHEIADIFPMMSEEEKVQLQVGIRENGYDSSHPVWLYEEKILDGRNRYEICKELGILPPFKEYPGTDPIGFVIQENLHRRQLEKSQRAAVAVDLIVMWQKLNPRGNRSKGSNLIPLGRNAKLAGKQMDVSHGYVVEAQSIKNKDPKAFEKIKSGELNISEYKKEKNVHVANNSGENEWYTPPKLIEAARQAMGGIDTDPASSDKANETVQANVYFTKDDDGLTKTWGGNVWMNPPYSQGLVDNFSEAIITKFKNGEIQQACVLVNNATETRWFQRMASKCSVMCLIMGRIKFLDETGTQANTPLQGQIILYFGVNSEQFCASFQQFGLIVLTKTSSETESILPE